MKRGTFTLLIIGLSIITTPIFAQDSDWSMDVGLRWFKYSAEGGPNEIDYNRVYDRWEQINQGGANTDVTSYQALSPLFFNFNFGADVFVRYRKYFLLKFGYDYSNPAGIGGEGHISYSDNNGDEYHEEKEFSYTSHQLNLFFGPLVPVDEVAEIYLAFAPFAPTWVQYQEKYKRVQNGEVLEEYDKTFNGFFGNCRALLGIQVRVYDRLKLGSEVVFAVFNYMKLKSGDLEDYSFRFPNMKWNFTVRYQLFQPLNLLILASRLDAYLDGFISQCEYARDFAVEDRRKRIENIESQHQVPVGVGLQGSGDRFEGFPPTHTLWQLDSQALQLEWDPGAIVSAPLSEDFPALKPHRLRHSALAFSHGELEFCEVAPGPEHPSK